MTDQPRIAFREKPWPDDDLEVVDLRYGEQAAALGLALNPAAQDTPSPVRPADA